MRIYKLLGAVGLLIAGMWFYYTHTLFQKKGIKQLDGYIRFITNIKAEIECYMLPITDILSRVSEREFKECGIEDSHGIKSIDDMISKAEFFLDDDTINALISFSSEFGVGYIEQQIRSCERCIATLISKRGELALKNEKDKKVSLAICLSLSLSLILILI